VTLLISEDQHYIKFEVPIGPHSHFSGPRKWSDRCRLLFQSICDTDWANISSASPRDAAEDEDLIAAMYVSMDDAYGSKWGRSRFNAVARALPSSHSQKLDGRVAIDDFRALLELLIVASVDCTLTEADVTSALDTLTIMLLVNGDSVDWDTFNSVVDAHMVCPCFEPLVLQLIANAASLAPRTRCIRLYSLPWPEIWS
jgi:hypothetical protein